MAGTGIQKASFGFIVLAALLGAGLFLTNRQQSIPAGTTAGDLERYYPASGNQAAAPRSRLEAELPTRFNEPLRIHSTGGTNGDLEVRPFSASAAIKTVATDGTTVYSNGFESCDVCYRSGTEKTEEFLYIRKPIDRGQWSWEIKVGELKPILLKNGAVLLVDQSNMPRLKISAPEGKDADGRALCCTDRLHVELGEPVAGSVRLTLSADLKGMRFPVAIDPSWSAASQLQTARADHTATLLNNGKVLVCGGQGGTVLSSAEIFDPSNGATGTWSSISASMVSPRFNHVAVLLPASGKVLIAGGNDGVTDLDTAELFDPAGNGGLGSFTAVPTTMSAKRTLARAVLLADQSVLILGGGSTPPLQSCERYLPGTNGFVATGSMTAPRLLFSATLLPDGKVLVAGGEPDNTGNTFLNTAELYDPAVGSGTFTALASNLITGRYRHQAMLLKDNSGVLLIGGFNNGLFPSAEIYNITDQDFDPTGSLTKARTEHKCAQFANGKILAVGCHDGSFAQVDLYNPTAGGTWGLTGSTLTPHTRHTLTNLSAADGRVIVIGGFVGGFSKACEIFDPKSEPASQTVNANASIPLSIVLQAATIDDAGVTFSTTSSPTNGSLTGTVPNLVYTAAAGYSGPDSFTFKSNDVFGLSKTGTITINVNSLIPTITQTSPDAAIATSNGFTLNVTGTNFVRTSVVQWNGSARPTTFVSTTQLTATISASDVASAGPQTLTVFNPPPGGGTSAPQVFTVLGGPLGQWIVTTINDSGTGSLRMAMNDARSGDSIIFDTNVFNLINSDAATVINLLSPLPLMDKGNVTIDASNVRVTVNGSGAGSSNGLQIVSNGNVIHGLTIVGFTKDGMFVTGNNNLIGGDRTLPATGTGPNGQGLRISGCGAFGIEVSGGSQNIIKGCWIGVDASGAAPQANLAGILIQNAGSLNQVGSTVSTEANVISGNQYEGITVSGTGTDNNLVMGNIVGGSATETTSRSVAPRDAFDLGSTIGGRTSVGNGSAGVFLSKGTTGTQVGGDSGQGNAIGFNGSSGIEVHANASKKNSSKHNGISKNHKKGIALFDGSNNNIQPPQFDIVYLTTSPRAVGSAGVHIEGHSTTDGTVEVFNDPVDQGGTILGRSESTNGQWKIDTNADVAENLTATITDASGNTSSFSLFGPTPTLPSPVITSPQTVSAIENISFAYTISASGVAPITFQAAGLPDGLTLNGNLISGTPTTPGTYMIHITASNSAGTYSITLVLAVISAFTVDTDGDGVPDWLESLAATDPNDSVSAPLEVPLSVDKAQIKLAASGAGDSVTLTMHLTLPSTFSILGGTANVQVGYILKNGLKVGSKGSKSTTNLTVKPLAKGSGSSAISFSIKKENLKSGLAGFGLTDQTTATSGTSVSLPVGITFTSGSTTYAAGSEVRLTYKAKKGKGGSAKK